MAQSGTCAHFPAESAEQLADHELIKWFVNHRDESAFTALDLRHGPMALRVRTTAESGRRQGAISVWGLPTVIAEPDGRFTIMH